MISKTDAPVPQELRLSSSTDDDNLPKKGPNIKYTKKKKILSTHPWALPIMKSFEGGDPVDKGPWVCQLCSTGPLKTVSGTRRHYQHHYKVWSYQYDTYREMNPAEREQQELSRKLKSTTDLFPSAVETGAQPVVNRQKRAKRQEELPAALGRAPDDMTMESSSSESQNISDPPRQDSRTIVFTGKPPDSPGPTVRKCTRPNQVTTGSRNLVRRPVINSPIKLSVPVRMEGIEFESRDDMNNGPSSDEDDVVCLDDEDEPDTKPEFVAFDQLKSRFNEETLTTLLVFGIEDMIEQDRRTVWPPTTTKQVESLRETYRIMLITVPIVRAMDAARKEKKKLGIK